MARAGLGRHFARGQGAFGSDHESRDALVPIAARRAGGVTAVVVVGDTPRDIACARAGGARCVAVTTGAFDAAALHERRRGRGRPGRRRRGHHGLALTVRSEADGPHRGVVGPDLAVGAPPEQRAHLLAADGARTPGSLRRRRPAAAAHSSSSPAAAIAARTPAQASRSATAQSRSSRKSAAPAAARVTESRSGGTGSVAPVAVAPPPPQAAETATAALKSTAATDDLHRRGTPPRRDTP